MWSQALRSVWGVWSVCAAATTILTQETLTLQEWEWHVEKMHLYASLTLFSLSYVPLLPISLHVYCRAGMCIYGGLVWLRREHLALLVPAAAGG
jgi:hypothetical protein